MLFADQWNNLDNRKAHYLSTGPEIWQQTEGKVDGFICAVGTGGTLAGTSQYLREMKKDVVIGCADPRGAAMYTLFSTGEAKATEGGSITEGIGLGRVTPIIDGLKVEKPYLIPDEEAVPIIFESARARGALPRRLIRHQRRWRDPPGQRTWGRATPSSPCSADSGTRYQSKLFNPQFLRSKKLPVPEWLERKSNVTVPFAKA